MHRHFITKNQFIKAKAKAKATAKAKFLKLNIFAKA